MAEVGERAPDVGLVDSEKKPTRISDFRGKPTVLLFFPGAFTNTCTKEMCTIRDNFSVYNQLGVNVVGISVDGPMASKAFKAANNINFPLLCDFNREAVKTYGNYHENFSGISGYTASKRVVYVLDKDQIVRFKWISENPSVEPDYAIIASEAEKVKSV